MRVFKPKWPDGKGGYKECGKFYIEVRDTSGVVRRFPGLRDEQSTAELGRKIARLIALHASGTAIDPTLTESIKRFPPRLRARLVKLGIIDGRQAAKTQSIGDLVGEWRKSLEARERTAKQVQQVTSRVERILEAAGVKSWNDITAVKVERVLKAKRDAGISVQSSNHMLGAVRQFMRWVVSNGLAVEDPLRVLRPLNVRLDRRLVRRALEPEALRELLRTTAMGPVRQGVSGPERALVYRVALETGLRANEIRSLRTASLHGLDTNEPSLTLHAAASKHRREDTLPLRLELARELAAHVRGRKPWEPVFALKKSWRPCEMLSHDLAAAGIPQRDEEGRVADFHSLRVAYISGLARAGVPPKVVQALARHSTPLLTYDRYVKLGKDDERRALEALPELAFTGSSERATWIR